MGSTTDPNQGPQERLWLWLALKISTVLLLVGTWLILSHL